MASRNEISYEDDFWEIGTSYDDKTGELMSPYSRLKKSLVKDYENYDFVKRNDAYYNMIDSYPSHNEFKKRWQRED